MIFLNWLYEIRSYVSSYGRYIRFRWLFPIIWAVALAGMVWFYGEQLSFGTWHPLASPRARLVVVGLIVLGYFVYLITNLVRARRADAGLIDAVTEDGRPDPARAAAEDVGELRARLKVALKTLKKTLGRGAIYRLPWYALIGAPGAGKTTALVNSGLHFPLADTTGPQPVQGVAGTRFCDWWFTDEAILIDTAGRYTAQNSEQSVDKAGWTGFLKLLRKHRARQPLNGALVMLGLDDLMAAEPAERVRQGRIIRTRLRELDDTFKLRVPAYLILTKTDRLAGFSAFFEGLDRTAREQVWGVTLPLPATGIEGSDLADRVRQGLGRLVERLNTLLLDRLQSETDAARRAEIFAFPSQVALLADPLHEVMSEIAAASRFDPPPRIRGLYFASAQQDAASLDLMTQAAAADFGVRPALHADTAGQGSKSFFLARLLRDVVFGEASLVSTDPRRERRNRLIRWVGTGVIAAGVLALCGWWGLDYLREEDRLAATESRLGVFAPAAAAVPVKNVADRDFDRVTRLLDQARDVAEPFAGTTPVRFGLPEQRDKVQSGTTDVYTRALNGFLLPRLILQVEADIKDRQADTNELVRIYPMLGSRVAMQPGVAHPVLAALVERVLPGDDKAATRASLARHVDALIAGPLVPIALDDRLLNQALTDERSRQLFERWSGQGGALCQSAIEGRYPFDKASQQDIERKAFTDLFAPGGAFDRFFQAELRDKVDASRSPWRWKSADRSGAAMLDSFERASVIRTAFFDAGGSLSVPFEVTPVGLDGSASSVVLTSDGQEVSFARGARGEFRPLALSWPGSLGVQGAGVDFQPAAPDTDMTKSGFWALFRVIDGGSTQALNARRSRVSFRSADDTAVFDIQVRAPVNPFDLSLLRGFHCPKVL